MPYADPQAYRDYMREYQRKHPRHAYLARAQREYRKRYPDLAIESHKIHNRAWRRKYPEKTAAHNTLNHAIESGIIVRPECCSQCSVRCTPHGHHHHGYAPEHQLDVAWLCKDCHAKLHRRTASRSA